MATAPRARPPMSARATTSHRVPAVTVVPAPAGPRGTWEECDGEHEEDRD